MTTTSADHEERFWVTAERYLARPGVSRSTMMGLPCLRVDGKFFGSFDRATGDLLVKLPEPRVAELVAAGRADSFAPAGRRFREWAAITPSRRRSWNALLDEALAFVTDQPKARPRKRK